MGLIKRFYSMEAESFTLFLYCLLKDTLVENITMYDDTIIVKFKDESCRIITVG